MDTIVKMSLNLMEFIASATSKMSFRDAAEEINRNTEAGITFQSVWNVAQKFREREVLLEFSQIVILKQI